MEDITRLVDALLARHGIKTSSGEPHLVWSRWFRCVSSASMLLAPGEAGILALAEEAISPGACLPRTGASSDGGDRILALFHFIEADDLGMALGQLFRTGNPVRRRLASGRCFARYALVEDPAERSAASSALRRSVEVPVLFVMEREDQTVLANIPLDFARARPGARNPDFDCGQRQPVQTPQSLRLATDAQNQGLWETVRRPAPLPSGF